MPQVVAAIGTIFGGAGAAGAAGAWWATAGATASFSLGTLATQLLSTVAVSALSSALAPKPKPAGIVTETTLSGDVNPTSFILGRYKTSGA